MVMKLLLIALNLETDRTEDNDEELAANRPLTSPFFCRTIHIDDRGGRHDDDDDDDDDGKQSSGLPRYAD